MNAVDEALFLLINAGAGRSGYFDSLVGMIAENALIKGAPPMLAVWFLWFRRGPEQQQARASLLGLLIISMIAIAVGRLSQATLPHRLRPLHADIEGFNLARRLDPTSLDGWSSMPSDHAVMFFSIAFGLFAINSALGIIAILHALLFVSLPRIYLGLHYPGDILVGIVVAAIIVFAFLPAATRLVVNRRIVPLADGYPQIFYPVLFLFTLEIATMFDATRQLLEEAAGIVRWAI